MTRHIAIILSAGSGRRMHTDVAKQYLEVQGLPLICHTIRAFEDSKVDEIVLVVGPGDVDRIKKDIVEPYAYKKVVTVVEGGAVRSASVYAGLCACEELENPGDEIFVHIHDGARCLITPKFINEMVDAARAKGAAALAVPVKDTIRKVTDNGWYDKSMKREELYIMQTPQSFEFGTIKKAFEAMRADPGRVEMTDDVMVLEVYGHKKSFFIPGDEENMKVTHPEDLFVVEGILKKRESKKQ